MRHIPFNPETDLDEEQKQWWDKWQARAVAKRDELIAKRGAGEAAEFDGSIWSDLKAWLIDNVFRGKCAYCEVKITPGFFGDGEHYRPKGNVTVVDDTGKRRTVDTDDGSCHPGYYWLAYDWRNLLPSCTKCNNRKSDQFPVGAAHVHLAAPEPAELDQVEQPLLINPYQEEPGNCLVFGACGVIAPVDDNPRGVATIKVFGLDRPELTEDRWRRQGEAVSALGPSLLDVFRERGTGTEEFDAWMGPKAPYSAAVLAEVRRRAKALKRVLDAI